jgi:hypothetical protein
MFLDVLRRRNPRFVEAAVALHREGRIPANAYVLDLDAVESNARAIKAEADRHGLKVFAMTKQVGRSSGFCRAVRRGGIRRSVAVDMACARATPPRRTAGRPPRAPYAGTPRRGAGGGGLAARLLERL